MHTTRRSLSAVLIASLTAALLLVGAPASAAPATHRAAAATASTFTPHSPVRVLDTRTGTGAVGAGRAITLDLAAHVPSTTTAVVLNVTVVTPTADTFVTVFPAGTTRPNTSSLNLPAGDTRANQVTVVLGANRRVSLYNNAGATHVVADLTGHYDTGAGAKYTGFVPNRVFDTRRPNGPALGPGTTREVDLATWIPASATAVTFNLTATEATAATFLTAWPTGTARPTASNINLPAGDTRPNQVTVAVGPGRKVSLYNNAGQTHVMVDLVGFHTPDYGASFLPSPPSRVLDTRNGTGGDGPVMPGTTVQLDLAGLPGTATGVALNVTGVDATGNLFVSVAGPPVSLLGISTLNLSAGQTAANAAAVALGNEPTVHLHNGSGLASVHLVADLVGVFAVVDPAPCTADCVLSWGANQSAQLGTAELAYSSSTPTPVVTLAGVRAVAGGVGTGYALRAGRVWAWGANHQRQLGNGWQGGWSAAPVPVVGLSAITAIAAGAANGYALRGDGTVWGWGDGGHGQLTNLGLLTSTPVHIAGVSEVAAIAVSGSTTYSSSGTTAYALRRDGTVWAWGDNRAGQLGTGSTAQNSPTPVQVAGLTDVTAIAGGGQGAYALRDDGTVWAWGMNNDGQLGDGRPCVPDVPCQSATPVQVAGLTGVTSIAGGTYNGYAVRGDGTAWAWGGGEEGKLGSGLDCQWPQSCDSRTPVRVAGLTDVTLVATAQDGGYALRSDGTVLAWGDNTNGALGDDDVAAYATVPVPVRGLSGVSTISGGWFAGYAIVPNP